MVSARARPALDLPAELAVMGAAGAVNILFRSEVKAAAAAEGASAPPAV